MDAVTQIAQKIAAERARNTISSHPPPPEADPPPYSPSCSDEDSDDDEPDTAPPQPLKLTINAAHSIRGTNNLVPTSPAPLADATKFSTLLLHSINQINNASHASRRPVRVELTINCGITVIGDRNVIGAVGLRPKAEGAGVGVIEGAVAGLRPSANVGAKRKAEAEEESDDPPVVKKVAVDAMSP